MGYAVYEDRDNDRWAGYGVPAECDWPNCHEHIDRGLDAKCEEHVTYSECEDPEDHEHPECEHVDEGCGLYFCGHHQGRPEAHNRITRGKPDSLEWQYHMLTHESWQQWRGENPERVARLREDPRLAEIQRIIDEHMGDLAARVIYVFDEAPPDATAEDVRPDVFAAVGLTEVRTGVA